VNLSTSGFCGDVVGVCRTTDRVICFVATWNLVVCVVGSLAIAWLTILWLSVAIAVHGRTGHTSFVAWSEVSGVSVVVLVAIVSSVGAGDGADSCHLGIVGVVCLGLATTLPEGGLAAALSVVVGGAWAESFLLLVVADKQELHDCSHEEEKDGDDGTGEAGSVESANLAKVVAAAG